MCWSRVKLGDLFRHCLDLPLGPHLAPPSPRLFLPWKNNPPYFPAFAWFRDRPAGSILSLSYCLSGWPHSAIPRRAGGWGSQPRRHLL